MLIKLDVQWYGSVHRDSRKQTEESHPGRKEHVDFMIHVPLRKLLILSENLERQRRSLMPRTDAKH